MKKIEIFVVSHKQLNLSKYPERKIIYVGKKHNFKVNNKTTFRDDTKNNISNLNPYYCELTALYWVWKNYPKSEYIGFEHYSRNFYKNLWRMAPLEYLYDKASGCDILHIAKSKHIKTSLIFWLRHEGTPLYPILKKALKKVAPEYYDDWKKVMNEHHMSYCNMFICKWEIFNKYMNFLFKVVNECYKNIGSLTKEEQSRSIGYIAERLLDAFIFHNRYKEKACFIKIKRH